MKKLAPLPVLLVLAGCGGATDLGPAPKAKSQAVAKLKSATPATEQKIVPLKIWLVRGKGLVQRNRAHPKTVRVATAALQELLAGPTEAERSGSAITTSIPGERACSASASTMESPPSTLPRSSRRAAAQGRSSFDWRRSSTRLRSSRA